MESGTDRDPEAKEELDHPQPVTTNITGQYRQCEYCRAPANLIHTTLGRVEIYQRGFLTLIKPHYADCDRPSAPQVIAEVSVQMENVPREVIQILTGMTEEEMDRIIDKDPGTYWGNS